MDYSLAKCQAQAMPSIRLGRKKWFKNFIPNSGINATTTVKHFNEASPGVRAHFNAHIAISGRFLRHGQRMVRIFNQIHNDLFKQMV